MDTRGQAPFIEPIKDTEREDLAAQALNYFRALMFSSSVPEMPAHLVGNLDAEEFAVALMEMRGAILMASKGNFSYKVASKGFVPGVIKGLQAKLNNLGWMAKRVADGDMQQRMDFMGDISDAFNLMVDQLSTTFKKFREEEEHWQLAMLCSGDGVWEVNLTSDTPPYYSVRMFELLGFSVEDAPSVIDWPKLFHPGDHQVLALYRQFISRSNPPHTFELDHKLLCADGVYRWFLTRGMTLLDPKSEKPLRVIGVTINIQDRKEREERFTYRATHDILTNLPNRLLFDEHLKNGIALARRSKSHLAVVMVDVDKFKEINDTLGHQTGDFVLAEIARRMQKNMRESDMVARFGGDEFAMALAFAKEEWHAITKVLERTMSAFKEPILVDGKEIFATVSFGVSVYPDHGDSIKLLMARADEALYRAKAMGRNICVFWKRGRRFSVVKIPGDTTS